MVTRYRFALLAPAQPADALREFGRVERDTFRYRELLAGVRQLRAKTYLEDGAITKGDLDASGGFGLDDDELCWHLLLLDETGAVIGCVRMRSHPNTAAFDDLRVRHAALAKHPRLGFHVRKAIEADLRLARENGLRYSEIGGWALAKQWRGTKAALDILAGAYALGELWGGSLGVATATFRHGSASMLMRMGAQRFVVNGEELPPYEDPQYGCMMELLRFTRTPAQKFSLLVDPLKKTLARSPVLAHRSASFARPRLRLVEAEVA